MKHHFTKRPQPAYIFGGMEAFIFQGLIGGILGAAWVIKSYWQRIKAYFTGETLEEEVQSEQDIPSDEE